MQMTLHTRMQLIRLGKRIKLWRKHSFMREQMANHKTELEKFTNLSNALTQAVAEANKALEDIMPPMRKVIQRKIKLLWL